MTKLHKKTSRREIQTKYNKLLTHNILYDDKYYVKSEWQERVRIKTGVRIGLTENMEFEQS